DIPAAIARGGPGATSRLVCPRRLGEQTWYRACVVPTLEGGRRMGLGNPTTDPQIALQPAWGGAGSVDLPVYLSWTFRTGPIEDFEELVKRLTSVEPEVLTTLGRRKVDASRPWPSDAAAPASVQTFEQDGALGVPGQQPQASGLDALRSRLTDQLNYPAR